MAENTKQRAHRRIRKSWSEEIREFSYALPFDLMICLLQAIPQLKNGISIQSIFYFNWNKFQLLPIMGPLDKFWENNLFEHKLKF